MAAKQLLAAIPKWVVNNESPVLMPPGSVLLFCDGLKIDHEIERCPIAKVY
jgi:hypothetical protein